MAERGAIGERRGEGSEGEEGGEGSEGETVRSNACEIAILWQCGVCAMPSTTSMCQYYVSVFASTLYSYYARNNVAHTKRPPHRDPIRMSHEGRTRGGTLRKLRSVCTVAPPERRHGTLAGGPGHADQPVHRSYHCCCWGG